ncbi:MAG: metallophosphoesterase [Lentisphaerae bacterium]|nr:metallophosphoesterase [Lentisphaerota bacterium]
MKILAFIFFGLIVWRMILVLKWKWYFKVPLILLAGTGAFKFQIFRVIGGHYFAPDLPGWIIMAGAWFYGAFYLLIPLWLISEAVRAFKMRKDQSLWNKINLGTVCAALCLSFIGLVCGAAAPRIMPYQIEHPQIPAAADNMKILFLTDLHIDRSTKIEKVQHLVKKANECKADLILLGGDLMDGPVAACGQAVAELEKLKAPLGVFTVPGNHEFYSGMESWNGFFQKSSIKMLLNEKRVLANGVILAGTGDSAANAFFRNDPVLKEFYNSNPQKALKGVADEEFVILLAHRPKTAQQSSLLRTDLQLSGHTHGGMIRGLDLLVGFYNGNWISGRYQVGKMTLLVSNGTWLWRGFPLRLGRPGEMLLITLKRK